MLETNFKLLSQNFSTQTELIKQLWMEIEIFHNTPTRHYHTLQHLANIDKERKKIKLNFEEDTIFQFATYYHDIIYNIESKNNEKESAILAKKRLYQLEVPNYIINEVCELINLTKMHKKIEKRVHAYFLDADLAILGASPKEYQRYIKQIREEYRVYNETIYNRGRQKVLKNFIEKKELYQTDYFRDRYEKQARENIKNEYN
ncbi:hypothetical protein MNB_SV-12-25 [hydrothermal vent metagenome]|uniref:Uncharacterized protein n=1 Tax=hydrothermal vent metagenome TaxID=652676 RepID=A0A1W1BAM6_9ZZZZ